MTSDHPWALRGFLLGVLLGLVVLILAGCGRAGGGADPLAQVPSAASAAPAIGPPGQLYTFEAWRRNVRCVAWIYNGTPTLSCT